MPIPSTPQVSIIIPAHNEAAHIQNCLESLASQTLQPLETIVVDDGSTDTTRDLVKLFPRVKLLTQSHRGPGAARNRGAKESRGDVLVFVDADMTFDPECIDKLVQPILKKQVVGTFTHDERVANSANPWADAWSRLRGFQAGRMHPAGYSQEQPVFRAITKAAFTRAGGFDTRRGYDDDWSLSEKLGLQARNAPGATVYHANPASPLELFRQARWMAKRRYKFGPLGKLIGLLRASLPVSLLRALYQAARHPSPTLFSAVLIADFGRFLGLLESLISGRSAR